MNIPVEIISIERQGEEIISLTVRLKPLLDRIRELEKEVAQLREVIQGPPEEEHF